MLIDWFTVAAQVLNFLVLVWLMKRLLYQPILRAIDEREKAIAARLADASKKELEAQQERDDFRHRHEQFEQQRSALFKQAAEEARGERQRLLNEARQAAESALAQREEGLRNDALNLNQAVSRRVQSEVFAVARQALADLATASLEERVSEAFTSRLRQLSREAKEALAAALRDATEPALVLSAFQLPREQQAALRAALNEVFASNVSVRFEAAPELVCGIELRANGQKVGWSIAEYLRSLEQGVTELLAEGGRVSHNVQALSQDAEASASEGRA